MLKTDPNVGGLLQCAFAEGHVGHAYIVVGEKQSIPTLLRECATVVMNPSHTFDDSEICHRVVTGQHQDVISLPSDKAKNRLTVADINLLVEESYKRPVDDSSIARVFTLDATGSVSGQGCELWQNKLLKTLEEPTEGVFIFVGVTDAEGLLPTVRSRCQILRRSIHTVAQVCDELRADGFDLRTCQIAASVSGGSLAEGKLVLNNPAVIAACERAVLFARDMTGTKNALRYVSPVVQNKDTVYDFLRFLQVIYRESIVSRVSPDLCMLTAMSDEIAAVSANYTIDACRAALDKVSVAKRALDDGANLQVTIDELASAISEVKYRCRQ